MNLPTATPTAFDRACDRARLTRDARFDGLFFIAVTSTRIYCRPVCPAPSPKKENIRYYTTAAAASAAGFRPCLRCRPEAAPGSPLHRSQQDLVGAALRLIEDGALDNDSVTALAARLGIGARHLRRLFDVQIGAGPLQVAATRRVLFAKKLLSETSLPVTEVVHASGYASVRRFNSAFRSAYRMAPRDLRRTNRAAPIGDGLTLRLPFRPPYDFPALLAFFARRAIPGVETVDATSYQRAFMHDKVPGQLTVSAATDGDALQLRIDYPRSAALLNLVAKVRRMFDLDADNLAINAQLGTSTHLKNLVRSHPGQRLPGAWDGFEIAVRAILGQQVSVAAARTMAARLVERHGVKLPAPIAHGILFPNAERLADVDLREIGVIGTRSETIRRLACAVSCGDIHFRGEQGLPAFVDAITELPGIGAWTAHYIAMRAFSHPDAFPAADLILRKAAGSDGVALSTKALEQMSEQWRPWRAYAVMHLWRSSN
jgi:AraC family transcriptional regulator, regulatory protein of adaptative response / DNA-3-methyladenine glycosylase II